MKVLVAYASKHGATSEIAETIGAILRTRGVEVDVKPIETVTHLLNYDAIVLGSAVYAGKWMKPAADCLLKKRSVLAKKPVWLFSSGPTGEGEPAEIMEGWTFPEDLKPVVEEIKPRDIALFHGNINLNKLNFAERAMIKVAKAPTGDYRDWEAVKAWAESMQLEPVSE